VGVWDGLLVPLCTPSAWEWIGGDEPTTGSSGSGPKQRDAGNYSASAIIAAPPFTGPHKGSKHSFSHSADARNSIAV